MSEFRLHCFCQSGNTYKAALMLELSGTRWTPVFVDFMHRATRDPDWRATVNEMGEVPVLEHGDLRITQSGVILDYLARLTGKFAAQSDTEQREIWRWILFDNHKFTSYFGTYRFMKSFAPAEPDPAVMAFLRGRIDGAYGIVDKHLAAQPFLLGGRPTIADLSLAGYVFYPIEEHGIDIAGQYRNLDAWRKRISALPGWRGPYELLPGERLAPLH